MSTPAVTPFEPKISSGDKFDPEKRRADIKQLYDASKKDFDDNYMEEMREAYRAVRVRTNPIMVTDAKGNKVEDTNRTNVCLPTQNTIVKRKTARKTANPPTLNYYVPGDDASLLGERLTARAYYEYDRSGEAWEFKRFVHQADIFGFSYAKTYHETVEIQRQMRYQVEKLRDRRELLKAQGAGEDQIQSAVEKMGPDVGDQELADYVSENGPEIRGTTPYVQYEGPVTTCRFIGDIFIEPGALTLNRSGYVIERYTETDLWIKKMANKTYRDPETKQDVPVFDREQVQKLWDAQRHTTSQDRLDDLRKELRIAIQKSEPVVEQRLLPGRRFDITEYHGPDKKGQMWIEYIGNETIYLGRQPYPFDLCGRFVYTEYVPWPDIIGAIGDSSPRLQRFLHSMANANMGQTIDLVNQVLRRTYKAASASDIPDEVLDKPFGRVLVMKGGDMNALQAFIEPNVPSDAWQTHALIDGQIRSNEPALGGVDAVGTDFNPQAGRTATTAILSAKSSDVLMQAEIDALNLSIKELAEKKLEIHRQLADKPIQFPNRPQYVKSEGLIERYGKTGMIEIDPYEIQDPAIQVEPVSGSTLAVDDELRASKIQTVYQMAEADPVTWNKYEAGKLLLTTIKGVGDTSKLLNQPVQPPPVMPKVSFNVAAKYDDFPDQVKGQLLTAAGLQIGPDTMAEMDAQTQIKHLPNISKAADAATNLASPAHPPLNGNGVLAEQAGKIERQIQHAP